LVTSDSGRSQGASREYETVPPVKKLERVLVLAPHTDDAEFAAGGTIARWIDEGVDVHSVAFSSCETSVPEGWPAEVLREEVRKASTILGLGDDQLRVLDFEVRHFARDRQDVLQAMVDLDRELQPDLVLMPTVGDLHQDHHTVATEGIRAFKQRSILAYEVPWNNLQFRTEAFVELTEVQVDIKVRAVGCYESQAHRVYSDPDYLRAQMRFRGTQIGVRYAEAFDVVRWVFAN
jgi:N-acetylglucosamine malate deacetylase 1